MIYLTGSTGYIGKQFSDFLIKLKIKHICIVRPNKKIKSTTYKKIIYFDIEKEKNLDVNFLEEDILIHLAWSSLDNYFNKDHSQKYPKIHFDFIHSLIKNNLKNILITGTCLEYGVKSGKVKEESICKPNTDYGKGKNKLLIKLKKLNKKMKFNFIWLRLFYIYSDNPKSNTILSELNKKTKKINFLQLINLTNVEILLI